MTSEAIPEHLIAQARGGDPAALGRLLELYRNYLRLVARSMIGVSLRVKVEPSDLVQDTFLKAHREFAGFEGRGEPELMAWLRRILARTLADQVKHHRCKGATFSSKSRSTCSWIGRTRPSTTRWPRMRHRPARGRLVASRRCCWPTRWPSSRPTIARSSSCVHCNTSHSRRSPRRWAARWGPCGCSGPAVERLKEMLEGEA